MPAALHPCVGNMDEGTVFETPGILSVASLNRGIIQSRLRVIAIKELPTFKQCMESHLLGVVIKKKGKSLFCSSF